MKKRYIFSVILGVLILILITYFVEKSFSFRLNELENYISSFGPWVPVLLLIIIIVTSSIGFIFMIPVALAALLLNIYLAFFISILGLTLGALISFYISRYFARDYVHKKYIKNIEVLNRYDEHIGKKGFFTILLLRLISLIPYELINVAAGFSRIGFIPFISATFIGIIPGTILTIYFIKSTENIFSAQFLWASILISGFSLLPLASRKVRKIIFSLK